MEAGGGPNRGGEAFATRANSLGRGLGQGWRLGLGLRGAGALREALARAFAGWIAQETHERRFFLWSPVFFGLGALAYFAADQEPALAPAALAAGLLALAALRARAAGRVWLMRACAAGAFLFAGFACATMRTAMVEAPALERPMATRATAYVESVDMRPGGARLHLRIVEMEGVAPERTPERVRVSLRGAPDFEAGATIRAALRLSPPPRASEPAGYDFSRDAYFRRIGAVGSVLSRVEIAPPAQVPLDARLIAWIDRGRNALTARIVASIGGTQGAVAASLVTGKRGLIPEETNETLRAAGIYHVVSISGLHMVLAAGMFMWSVRALLACAPAIALRFPIKKWAAATAMVGAVAYDLFSGAEVATERAMVMMLVILGAVLFDRPAISMRNLAIAALFVLAREPSTLLGPSFQMSFAAVAAMIALFEKGPSNRIFLREAPPGAFERVARVALAMVATTLVAGLSTEPFASYHFHRVSAYGLVGNALALPLVEFIVMPAAAVGVLASAFGLDAPVWRLMGFGVDAMLQAADFVARLPGAVQHVPAFGPGALALMTLGLLWLTLWRSAMRWFGLAFAIVGGALALDAPRPDLIADARGSTVAFRGADGKLVALNGQANPFALAQWLAADADPRTPRNLGVAQNGAAQNGLAQARCDAQGCVGRLPDGRSLALVLRLSALAEDCGRADVLVTPLRAREICAGAARQPALLMDAAHFAARGATHAFVAPEGGFSLRTVREPGLDRPWTRAPRATLPANAAGSGSLDEEGGLDRDEDAFAREERAPDLRD